MSCTNISKDKPTERIIRGKIVSDKAQKVYLKKIDNFNYLRNDYILDSAEVKSNGEFEFVVHDSTTHLLGLSTKSFLPATFVVLRQAPQLYYYGSCSNFFASEPVFFLNDRDSLDVTWYDNRIVDSIVHRTQFGKSQDTFRDFYYTKVRQLDGYENIDENADYCEVWEKALKNRDKLLKELVHDPKNMRKSGLENYFYTETVLTSLNLFLNWYEDAHYNEVQKAITSKNREHFYNRLFAIYNSHIWHPESFEFYKFTERYVNYQMNLRNGKFVNYHVPSKDKLAIASETLEGKNRSLYSTLLQQQMGFSE